MKTFFDKTRGLALHLIFFFFFFLFSRFSPFNYCLSVVLQLDKGDYPKICRLCFVPINSVLLNLLCVWIFSLAHQLKKLHLK